MILENIRSAADNIVDRIKNPFGGTLIAAWCILNWRLVYSVFSFDDDYKLIDRISFIQRYVDETTLWQLVWGPVLYSFGVIFTYLILTHISLAIFTFFQKWVTPSVFWLLDRNKITDKSSYDSVKSKLIRSQKNFDNVRQELVIAKDSLEESRKELIDIHRKYDSLNQDFELFKNRKSVFIENFEEDLGLWKKNYWGKAGSNICSISNGKMIFNISSPEDLLNEPNAKGGGSYVDIIGGIFDGETYQISVKAKAEDNSTLKFKLWIHDTQSGQSSETHATRITSEEIVVQNTYKANKTNAIRIHLHIVEGIGILYLRNLRVIRID